MNKLPFITVWFIGDHAVTLPLRSLVVGDWWVRVFVRGEPEPRSYWKQWVRRMKVRDEVEAG